MSEFGLADYVLACCSVVTMCGGVAVSAVYLYLGFTRMDEILGCVKRCEIVERNKFYFYMGGLGRLIMVGMVAGFLAYPKFLVKKGAMDARDIESFPELLGRRLVILFNVHLVLFVSFVVELIALKVIRS